MDLSSDEVKRFATQSTFFDFDQAIVVRTGSWSRILHRDEHTSHGIDFKPHKKQQKHTQKTHFFIFLGREYGASSSFVHLRVSFLGGERTSHFRHDARANSICQESSPGLSCETNRGRGATLWTAKAVKCWRSREHCFTNADGEVGRRRHQGCSDKVEDRRCYARKGRPSVRSGSRREGDEAFRADRGKRSGLSKDPQTVQVLSVTRSGVGEES